jgi:hypothetical protein
MSIREKMGRYGTAMNLEAVSLKMITRTFRFKKILKMLFFSIERWYRDRCSYFAKSLGGLKNFCHDNGRIRIDFLTPK